MKLILWVGLITLAVISCKKNEIENIFDENVIEQEIIIENLLAELDLFTEEIIDNQLKFLKSADLNEGDEDDSCPVITYYRNSEPRKIIIDYGTGCEGKDGKIRSGRIIITSSLFENLMATRVKTFENFTVNERKIEGEISKTVTLNREDRTRVSSVSEELTITLNEKTATRKGTMTRSHELGEPFDRSDDIISSWGEVVTVRSGGLTVRKTIEESNPLVFLNACRQIVSGIVTVTAGENSWSVDYGQGDCDNIAITNRNGVEKEINIGRR